MRHMSTPRANGRIIRFVVALVIGVAATSISAYWPLYMVERGGGARITTVYRGLYGWWNARDSVIGLHWSNLQLLENPLNAPVFEGELAPWEEPPPPPYPQAQFLRIGTLSAGWPRPVIAMRWTVTSRTRNFPVPAELDDADTSIVYAAESALTGSRGGGPDEFHLLWQGIAIDVVFFGAIVVGPIALLRRLARPVTPPATLAAAQ
ncbi:MAG: hypothetical protein RLY72_1895 [Planctomycetota bacterium]